MGVPFSALFFSHGKALTCGVFACIPLAGLSWCNSAICHVEYSGLGPPIPVTCRGMTDDCGGRESTWPPSEWACVTSSKAELIAHELWERIYSHYHGCIFPAMFLFPTYLYFFNSFFGKRGENCSKQKRKNWKCGWGRVWPQKKSTRGFWRVRELFWILLWSRLHDSMRLSTLTELYAKKGASAA